MIKKNINTSYSSKNSDVLLLSIYFFVLITLNCTTEPSEPIFKEQVIVNAYLYVDKGIDSVFVSKSLGIEEPYSYEKAAVNTADVFISVDNKTYQLFEYIEKPGAYYLPYDSLVVTAGKEYRLEIHVGEKIVRANTTAPAQVQIDSINTDTTDHLGTQFELFWHKTDWAAGYLVSAIAKSTSELVDLGAIGDARLGMFDDDTLKAFPQIMNFPVNELDTLFQMPWFMFWYYGESNVKLYAIDQNLFDLSTSPSMFQPQSSEFEQPTYHVDGGIGIFAAVSVDSVQVYVRR